MKHETLECLIILLKFSKMTSLNYIEKINNLNNHHSSTIISHFPSN